MLVFYYFGVDYQVTLSVAGMVFDHNAEYSRQLSEMSTISFTVDNNSGNVGIYHSLTFPNTPQPIGDVNTVLPELLGAGRYHIQVSESSVNYHAEIVRDLTDKYRTTGNTSLRGAE